MQFNSSCLLQCGVLLWCGVASLSLLGFLLSLEPIGNLFVNAKVRPVGHAHNFVFLLVELLKAGEGRAMLNQSGVPGHNSSMLQTDCHSLFPLLANPHFHVWEQEMPSIERATSCLLHRWRVAFVPNCDSLAVVAAIHMVFVPAVHHHDRHGCPRCV